MTQFPLYHIGYSYTQIFVLSFIAIHTRNIQLYGASFLVNRTYNETLRVTGRLKFFSFLGNPPSVQDFFVM